MAPWTHGTLWASPTQRTSSLQPSSSPERHTAQTFTHQQRTTQKHWWKLARWLVTSLGSGLAKPTSYNSFVLKPTSYNSLVLKPVVRRVPMPTLQTIIVLNPTGPSVQAKIVPSTEAYRLQ